MEWTPSEKELRIIQSWKKAQARVIIISAISLTVSIISLVVKLFL